MRIAKLRDTWRVRALGAALAVTLIGAMAFAASASALPARFWGVVPQTDLTGEEFQRLKRGGVDSVRIPFDWGSLQPTRDGGIDFSTVDPLIEKAAGQGLDVLPFVSGAPTWAVPHRNVPGGGGIKTVARLPVSGKAAGAWRKLLRQAVLRYGPRGSFWRQHPELPKKAVHAWQIWNEPNFKYFVAKPNAAEYGKLVKRSYGIVKRTDPKARVVLGGMFAQPKNCLKRKRPQSPCAADFLEDMFERTPGLRKRFDAAALHPYTRSFQELKPRTEEIREVLADNRAAGKSLWITEMGWSSEPPEPRRNVFAKGVNGQRNQLKGAFRLLKRKAGKWRIKRVYWFSVNDLEGSCNFCDGSGLFGDGFVPKKSWYAYARFAGGRAN